jgi:hypothetical protein
MYELSRLKSKVVALVICVAVSGLSLRAESRTRCGFEGSWLGSVDDLGYSIRFLNVLNRGSNGASGTLVVNWVLPPVLPPTSAGEVQLTPGAGSWQKISATSFRYGWRAYGLDAAGIAYVVRNSGVAHLTSCNHIDFDYKLEVFLPHQDLETEDPIAVIPGIGEKERIPLSCAECE